MMTLANSLTMQIDIKLDEQDMQDTDGEVGTSS